MPQLVDFLGLGEEAVPAEIEAVALADVGASNPADLVGRLEHDHRLALLSQEVARRQPGGTAAESKHRMLRGDLPPPRPPGARIKFALSAGIASACVDIGHQIQDT